MKLTVKISKGEKYYTATVKELRVVTQGKTYEEAKRNLKEAVELHLESLFEYLSKYRKSEIEKGIAISA